MKRTASFFFSFVVLAALIVSVAAEDHRCCDSGYSVSPLVYTGDTFTFATKITFDENATPIDTMYFKSYVFDFRFIESLNEQGKNATLKDYPGYEFPSTPGGVEHMGGVDLYKDGEPVAIGTVTGPGDYWLVYRFRAVKPGRVDFILHCIDLGKGEGIPSTIKADCYRAVPVTIASRVLPMESIMRVLRMGGAKAKS